MRAPGSATVRAHDRTGGVRLARPPADRRLQRARTVEAPAGRDGPSAGGVAAVPLLVGAARLGAAGLGLAGRPLGRGGGGRAGHRPARCVLTADVPAGTPLPGSTSGMSSSGSRRSPGWPTPRCSRGWPRHAARSWSPSGWRSRSSQSADGSWRLIDADGRAFGTATAPPAAPCAWPATRAGARRRPAAGRRRVGGRLAARRPGRAGRGGRTRGAPMTSGWRCVGGPTVRWGCAGRRRHRKAASCALLTQRAGRGVRRLDAADARPPPSAAWRGRRPPSRDSAGISARACASHRRVAYRAGATLIPDITITLYLRLRVLPHDRRPSPVGPVRRRAREDRAWQHRRTTSPSSRSSASAAAASTPSTG